jgi:hypothetical protein
MGLKRKYAFVVAAGIVVAAAAAIVVLRSSDAEANARADAPKSTFSVVQAKAFGEFPLYNAGDAVEGLPLVAELRRVGGAANYVSFIYGDCTAVDDYGCASPVEIQIWPACVRNPSLYAAPSAPVGEKAAIRGVPAMFYEDGRRLEIQTGISTVVVFGRTQADVVTVADALRGVNVAVRVADDLPAAAAGALDGSLRCDR